jgi:cellulose synthase/poly-beta-1,6-N-acetylglucosamine synthase-like glycosyltransferase
MPLAEQLNRGLLPRYQWAAQEYSAAHAGTYVDSVLGRNAAVHRTLLESVGAFEDDVRTGTDYHLGKRIRAARYAIRHVRHSLVRTDYPASLFIYARQQRRWLRNVALLGAESRSWPEVLRAIQTSLVGAAMLLSPLAIPALGPALGVVWAAAFMYSVAAKVRYVAFISRMTGQRYTGIALVSPAVTLLEFGVWALPLLDYPLAARRWQW